jgi:hypothetical protein
MTALQLDDASLQTPLTAAVLLSPPQPSVASVSPPAASADGGAVLFLSGSGFTAASQCRGWGEGAFFVSTALLACEAPPGEAGETVFARVGGRDESLGDVFAWEGWDGATSLAASLALLAPPTPRRPTQKRPRQKRPRRRQQPQKRKQRPARRGRVLVPILTRNNFSQGLRA